MSCVELLETLAGLDSPLPGGETSAGLDSPLSGGETSAGLDPPLPGGETSAGLDPPLPGGDTGFKSRNSPFALASPLGLGCAPSGVGCAASPGLASANTDPLSRFGLVSADDGLASAGSG